MEIEAARDFIRQHHRAILATTKRDGSPQMSPVSVGIDDDGYAVVSSRRHLAKVRNLERNPRASLCVFGGEFFGPWCQVDGPVEILRLPEAMEHLVAYYRTLTGEHPDWDDYRAAMQRDGRVLLRMTITSAVG